MNCNICNRPIIPTPCAAARAARDVTGQSADYYTRIFPQHSNCLIAKRSAAVRRLYNENRLPR